MRIALDLDEVLASFLESFVRFHNKHYNTDYMAEDFTTYRFWQTIGGGIEDDLKKIYKFYETDLYDEIEPIPKAKYAVKKLQKNNDLYVVTSRQKDFATKTFAWLDKHFPEAFSDVYFTNVYTKDDSLRENKSYFCDKLGADVMVDDCLDYALECRRPERDVLLFKYPWNEGKDIPSDIRVVDGWPEALSILQK